MSFSRRDLLLGTAALGTAALAHKASAQHTHHHPAPTAPPQPDPGAPLSTPLPTPPGWKDDGTVITPNGHRAPWKLVDGTKIFHLVAEPVRHEICPGLVIDAWGYNGSTPGPTIEVTEGDRCRFYVTNRLPEITSVHWHGVFVPNGMDGVAGLTQPPIAPGETFVCDFTFGRAGTFMYHPHADEMTQIALGMMGTIVVHPRGPRPRVRDYAMLLHEWSIAPGASRPDPLAMNSFNVLTINSRAFPGTAPVLAQRGDKVRLRLANMSPMDHHPIHIHGHAMTVVGTDGGPVPASARVPETTVLVPVGSIRVVEFTADANGDWPLHCHMTHHIMNQMGHHLPPMIGADVRAADRKLRKAIPGYMTMGHTGMANMAEMGHTMPDNSIPMKGGPGPFGNIDMGGMFTLVKIRETLKGDTDPGPYEHPKGTLARVADATELARDGIDVPGPAR